MVERYVKQFRIRKEGTEESYRADIELIIGKAITKDFEDLRVKEFISIAFMGNLYYFPTGKGKPFLVATGQINDEIEQLKKTWKIPRELSFILEVWKRYHHNTLKLGTKRQIETLRKKDETLLCISNYDKAVEYLESIGLYEDRGYRYGSEWLAEKIPDEVIIGLKQIFAKSQKKKRNRKKKLVKVRFEDVEEGSIYDIFLIKTSLSKEELEEVAREVSLSFLKQHLPWSFRDIIRELEKRGLVENIGTEWVIRIPAY